MNQQIKLPASQTAANRGRIVLAIKDQQRSKPQLGYQLMTAMVHAELEDLARVEGQPWTGDVDMGVDMGQVEDTIEALDLVQAGVDVVAALGSGWRRLAGDLDEWPEE